MSEQQLQKAPRGLLDLFRLRTFGLQPDRFSNVIQPSVDVLAQYGSDLLQTTTSPPTVGALLNLTEAITFAERAHLLGISGLLTLGAAAGTNVYVEVGIQLPNNASPQHVLGSIMFPAVAATQIVSVTGIVPGNGFVIGPQAQIYARAGGTAAGVDHSLQLTACYYNIAGGG